MAQPTYRELLDQIKKGKAAPVNILMGEEDYYIDMLVDAYERDVISEEDKDFNYNLYFGVDADLDQVVAACQQLPMMAEKRLVILKEAQSMARGKQALDKLASYVRNAVSTTVFVLAFKGENLNATSELMKAATKSGAVVFKSEKVRDYKLPGLVKDYCSSKRIRVDDRAVEMLCEYIGSPLTKLFGEINKLIQIKGGEGVINIEDVEKHIGVSKDFNNFELVSALAKKDYPKALKIIKYFSQNPKTNPTIMTTGQLLTFFSKLVIAHYLPDKSEASIKQELGIKFPAQMNELKEALRNYNPRQAVFAIHALRDFDVRSKGVGSFQNEYDLLRELIFKIFTL